MIRRFLCLAIFSMLALLAFFGAQKHVSARNSVNAASAKVTGSHAAIANWSRRILTPAAPPTQIGFLSAIDIPAGGGTFPSFPGVVGDFKGDGTQDIAAIVNTGTAGHPVYQIAAELSNGTGSFTTVLTATAAAEQDPIFVGDLNGDGKDDLLLVHPASNPANPTTIQGWLSNGDGTFTAVGTTLAVTTNPFVWATLFPHAGTGTLDVVLADGTNPGHIWTLVGNGDGTFQNPSAVLIHGQLSVGPPGGVPGNPIVFGDFNGDGKLDFAAPLAANNQISVYLGGAFTTPVALATPDSVYDSCFIGGGNLITANAPKFDLVSANCFDNTVTVYKNNGSGVFATGVYYPALGDPVAVSVADVNGDGNSDVVVTGFQSADVKVLAGNGDGTVGAAAVGYVTGGSPLVPALVADFNGDSNPDIILPDNDFSFAYLQGYGDGSFRSGINFYSETGNGFRPQGVNLATGDFNGDGIPDFVIGNTNAPTGTTGITVFLSNADGSLQPGVNYCPIAGCGGGSHFNLQYAAVADFNGDGKLDIAASDSYNGVIQIFTGKGDGTFTVGPTYKTDSATGAIPLELVAADFNGDGKPDLAVVNNYSSGTKADVGILLNNGAGLFTLKGNSPLSILATEITAADVNGDKKLDLAVPLYGTITAPGSAVAILLGNGDGTFKAEADVPLTNGATHYFNPNAVAIGDLNGDGKVDLAVTIDDQSAHPTQGIAVALGNGNGTFQAPTLLLSTLQNPALDVPLPGYVKIVDLNGDGHQDLVYSNSQFSTVGVLYGLGNGTFYDPVEFAADRWTWGLAVVDVNGDGALDVVASGNSYDFSGAAVLLNSGGNKVVLTSSPNPANLGASVTFNAQVSVTVRGVTAKPTGSVTFFDGSTSLGSGTVNSSGLATFSTSTLAGGVHSITARYNGDVNFVPTSSKVLTQTVSAPDYTLTASPTAATVTPGASAAFTITMSTTNGYDGTVAFTPTSCTGLPAGAACSFSAGSIKGSGTTTLTISTTAPSAAMLTPADVNSQRGETNLWASLGGLGMIGMVLAGDWKKRNRRRMGIVLTVLAVAMLLALVGCGGGSSSSASGSGGGGGGTPAGTSTIQLSVTGTAGDNGGSTAAHKLTTPITLTVN